MLNTSVDKFMKKHIVAAAFVALSGSVSAAPDVISDAVPQATIVGEGKFTYYLWDVYKASLYAPNGKWEGAPPYALKLTYLRDLTGQKIAERSTKEMRKQGGLDNAQLDEWDQKMKSIFPDVEEDDTLTGVATDAGHTKFFFNGEPIGSVEDAEFTERFFGIWLSEKTSEPEFREKLLNGASE
ncbi:chalcone isomerase family protein [Salinimonas lutimaris]|uniref:chalcone isomerase family protein n=1 Tax=Salinimonas lutimaris TaxID=914153 RepID=UPI001E296B20|nr:chalcone isomerase family protein [Salinimonas lutimaris]